MSNRTNVLIVYTGGTIGMVEDAESGSLHPFDFDHLLEEIPELNKFDIDISSVSINEPIDSSNISSDTWVELLEILEENYAKFDGFVILHGSDTMAYSASALSFLMENVNKPVIFTGSQLPIGKIRTDGKENLITAIEIAAEKKSNGEAVVPEVAIYFEYSLYRANRTTKISAENFEAFHSPNYPLLAEAGVHIKYNHHAIQKPNGKNLVCRKNINTQVASIKFFPGITAEYFKAVASVPNLKGLIIETYGSGNTPIADWLSQELQTLKDKGVIVVNITQCTTGSVDQSKYQTGTHLQQSGVIGGKDITYEAAITKLMYLLSCEELRFEDQLNYMKESIRGEMS